MNRIRVARAAALAGYFGLLILLPLWYGVISPSTLPLWLVLGFFLVPLFFPLRGLLLGRPYTYAWASFLSLLYFIYGVGEVFGDPTDRRLALLEVLFSLSFYSGGIFFARWEGRRRREAQAAVSAEQVSDKGNG